MLFGLRSGSKSAGFTLMASYFVFSRPAKPSYRPSRPLSFPLPTLWPDRRLHRAGICTHACMDISLVSHKQRRVLAFIVLHNQHPFHISNLIMNGTVQSTFIFSNVSKSPASSSMGQEPKVAACNVRRAMVEIWSPGRPLHCVNEPTRVIVIFLSVVIVTIAIWFGNLKLQQYRGARNGDRPVNPHRHI